MPYRSYSLSAEIMRTRKDYYRILEDVQSLRTLTEWYEWFLLIFIGAVESSKELLAAAFFKAAFWNRAKDMALNDRQKKALQKMLELGPAGFEGGLSTRKYANFTHTSKATAFREIEDMHSKGLLIRLGGGRTIRYELDAGDFRP